MLQADTSIYHTTSAMHNNRANVKSLLLVGKKCISNAKFPHVKSTRVAAHTQFFIRKHVYNRLHCQVWCILQDSRMGRLAAAEPAKVADLEGRRTAGKKSGLWKLTGPTFDHLHLCSSSLQKPLMVLSCTSTLQYYPLHAFGKCYQTWVWAEHVHHACWVWYCVPYVAS